MAVLRFGFNTFLLYCLVTRIASKLLQLTCDALTCLGWPLGALARVDLGLSLCSVKQCLPAELPKPNIPQACSSKQLRSLQEGIAPCNQRKRAACLLVCLLVSLLWTSAKALAARALKTSEYLLLGGPSGKLQNAGRPPCRAIAGCFRYFISSHIHVPSRCLNLYTAGRRLVLCRGISMSHFVCVL